MSTFTDVREQIGSRLQSYNFEVFKEPRGTIRILQLVFCLITLVILRTYEGYIDIEYGEKNNSSHVRLVFDYPFNLDTVSETINVSTSPVPVIISLKNDFSSEAEFLFTTCWVTVLYVVIIAFVYVKFREDYESNGNLALVDFVASVILAVLWVACLGAWGYGQSELKKCTQPDYLKNSLHICVAKYKDHINCLTVTRGPVSALTETMILTFLNFFLWGASLWFLYKETPWYLQFQRA